MDMVCVYLQNSGYRVRVTRIGCLVLFGCLTGSCSDTSGPATPPATPSDLEATAIAPRAIQLTWTHTGGEVDLFRIERRHVGPQGPAPFAEHATVPGDARSYIDADLQEATQYDYRLRACRRDACSLRTLTVIASTNNPLRALADRADDVSGPQIRVMYVVASDGSDRVLDTDGTLARSVDSFHAWFQQRSGGHTLRFDRTADVLDIGFFRLPIATAEMANAGAFVVSEIDRLMGEAGLLAPDKIYLVYYDGTSRHACGGAAWPPNVPGQVAAMYLQAQPSGGSCATSFVSSPTSPPGYWEFAALHDLLHTFGIVSRSAPHHQDEYPAHVPEQNDLMFTGTGSWMIGPTMIIDVGNDDYFGDDVSASLASLDTSPYVDPPPVAITAPRAIQHELNVLEAASLRERFSRLPLHPPFPTTRQSLH